MKKLSAHDLALVSGGTSLYITQEINLDGISNACAFGLFESTQRLISGTILEDDVPDFISQFCDDDELTALEFKVFMAVPVRVELV